MLHMMHTHPCVKRSFEFSISEATQGVVVVVCVGGGGVWLWVVEEVVMVLVVVERSLRDEHAC